MRGAAARQRAAARLQAKFLREIPLTRHLGLRVDDYAGDELRVSAPLGPNVNDKGTAFAGSLNALMTLAGWGLVHLRLQEAGEDCDIVIHKGELAFTAPIRRPFRAVAVSCRVPPMSRVTVEGVTVTLAMASPSSTPVPSLPPQDPRTRERTSGAARRT